MLGLIFIICPTFSDNKTHNRSLLRNCIIFFDGELVRNIDSLIKRHSKDGDISGKKSLIILENCSTDQDLRHRSALSKIAFSGRHSSLTKWFITQRHVSVPKDFRENIHWVLIAKNICKESFETLMSKNDVIPIKEQQKVW